MTTTIIIPAFLLGLASSLHCIGMCGPLGLAMPVTGISKKGRRLNIAAYQTGRILTYTCLGMLAGIAGKGFWMSGYQQTLSIVAGLIVIIAATGYYTGRKAKPLSFLNGFYQFLSQLLLKLIKKAGRPGGAFLFGMGNGLLPCGMVYLAAMASLTYEGIDQSALFMLMFGAGTLPAMLLAALAGFRINRQKYRWLIKLTPVIITATGLLLIIRGLNLDIPYLSPAPDHLMTGGVSCHH